MKKWGVITMLLIAAMTFKPVQSEAQVTEIAQIIKEGIKKVIQAVDLQIQRWQNKTIWLQNAQKAVENTLSKLKLDEISDWVEKQRKLYADYFEELNRVRSIIAYYHQIKSIIEKQIKIVEQYKKAYALFRQDAHFTVKEIQYMGKVYTGIFDESLKNLDQLFMVINSFETTMTDAQRLVIINHVSNNIDRNYYDLQAFNNENKLLSLQRAKGEQEIEATKSLYGIK
jgi:hypothetical protein